MILEEGDTIEITISGIEYHTYLKHGEETTVTADVTSDPNGDGIAVFLELRKDLGGLVEGRIDVDEALVNTENGETIEMDVLTMFDAESGDGPHWAGLIEDIDKI